MPKRVVVTGLGAVTALGNDVTSYWNNLLANKSGVGINPHFPLEGFTSKIAGAVKNFDPGDLVDKKDLRRFDLFVQYGLVASQEAIKHAGIDLETIDRSRFGVYIGCGIGGIGVAETQKEILLEKGPGRVSPFLVPMMIPNAAPGIIAIKFQLRGPNMALVTACASGNNALGESMRCIQRGDADIMLAGGTESAITPLGVAGFCSAKALSLRNDEPERASRPFDRDRDGFVISEGAGIVVLESEEHAKARGAKILAEIAGYGMSDDGHHMTAPLPDGWGGAKAMANALKDAGVQPEEIQYINAHGTSTLAGDIGETQAIHSVFGSHAKRLMISSTKSLIGHALGAAGGVEFIAVVKSIESGMVHGTLNLENPDSACGDLDFVPDGPRRAELRCALSNSFGFGGHNVSVLVKRYSS
jgi:3-oxoacyl-[acyl-carrier-protein] synthase II